MSKLCAICGNNPATTKDHIPPKGIYPKPWDPKMQFNTVPACSSCNNGGAVEDEEFKILIGISTGSFADNPDALIDSMAKTIGKNQRIANGIFSTKQNVYAKLSGKVLEPAVAVTFDGKKYAKVITRIVRSLYWMQQDKALGHSANIHVLPTQSMNLDLTNSMSDLMKSLPALALNDGTFVYKVQFCEDGKSIWGMQFFGKHTVFAYVSEQSDNAA